MIVALIIVFALMLVLADDAASFLFLLILIWIISDKC